MIGSYPKPRWFEEYNLEGADLLEWWKLEKHFQAYRDAGEARPERSDIILLSEFHADRCLRLVEPRLAPPGDKNVRAFIDDSSPPPSRYRCCRR
jgi:hypothetical protein